MGPEHEFSIVAGDLRVLPIVDKVLKDFHGHVVNFFEQSEFTFGKELQMHVLEIKPNAPFRSPKVFEQKMQRAVTFLSDFLHRKYEAKLLGTGMHPLMKLNETSVWPHRHKQIYKAYSKLFNLNQHGWLNIQSFQLNLPYTNESEGVKMHNVLANILPYLPAITASSPLSEGKFGINVDNRLHFYLLNQREVPSVTGDIIPEYIDSFSEYRREIIGKYSSEMESAGADKLILYKDWVNSRGVIFRFERKALEIRVMDEQECIKSDVAVSCFIRALLRGVLAGNPQLLPHDVLVNDFNAVVTNGLSAQSSGRSVGSVCQSLYEIALKNASSQEKEYLPLVKKRLQRGNLSEIIRKRIEDKAKKTDFEEAIITVYSKLAESLIDNQPYF